jgi:uncharacterized membrane protein
MKLFYSFLLSIFALITVNTVVIANNDIEFPEPQEELAKVVDIINEEVDPALNVFGPGQKLQTLKIKILSGDLKGNTYTIENRLSGNPAYDINAKVGDSVILNIEELPGGETEINIANYHRFPALAILFSVFVLLILIIGRIKGLKALISLGITYFLIFYFMIPMILRGYSPLLITILICFIATTATILIISGANLKSLSAIIGTVTGVSTAGIIALITIQIAPLSGMPNEEAIGLWTANHNLNFTGILASAMIIGALGASMDVGISIASSIYEIKQAHPAANPAYLMKAGMNVGKDIMGTMTNTLLLAYTGSAMFLLLIAYNNVSFMKFTNLDSIVSEITAAFAGSIGLILCIPITALVAAYLLNIKKPEITSIVEE